ncbi:MAG: phosphoglycerate kinase, partial [Candidatus Pacebacteria bacterium]|nr:phosphoglycerate kinase [Candidatus Paceibacterota bacterium]
DTIQLFKDIIKDSATVIWNGPLGFIEDKKFAKGTEEIARFLSTLSNFRIVGGGETVSLVINLGLEDKFNFISTGGGAMLDFLSGEKLPGLEALGYY